MLNFLQKIGITKEEYLLYKEILINPPTNLTDLSRKTNISRSTMYSILSLLEQKGLIIKTTNYKSGIKYKALNPDKLLDYANDYRKNIDSEINDFQKNIEYLKAQTQDQTDREDPEIKIIRGNNTQDELDLMILSEGKELFGFSYIYNVKSCFKKDKSGRLLPNEYLSVVMRLTDKFVFPADAQTLKEVRDFVKKNPILKDKWFPRYLPKDEFKFNINFYCFGDKVAFALGQTNEKDYLAYIIKNKEIAESMTNLSIYIWRKAKPIF